MQNQPTGKCFYIHVYLNIYHIEILKYNKLVRPLKKIKMTETDCTPISFKIVTDLVVIGLICTSPHPGGYWA